MFPPQVSVVAGDLNKEASFEMVALQSMFWTPKSYDVVWAQWCLLYLTDCESCGTQHAWGRVPLYVPRRSHHARVPPRQRRLQLRMLRVLLGGVTQTTWRARCGTSSGR